MRRISYRNKTYARVMSFRDKLLEKKRVITMLLIPDGKGLFEGYFTV